MRPPFGIGVTAIVAVAACYEADAQLRHRIRLITSERRSLRSQLQAMGVYSTDSHANFVYLPGTGGRPGERCSTRPGCKCATTTTAGCGSASVCAHPPGPSWRRYRPGCSSGPCARGSGHVPLIRRAGSEVGILLWVVCDDVALRRIRQYRSRAHAAPRSTTCPARRAWSSCE